MNLQELVGRGESETLEYKEKFDERTLESAAAFANTKGGIVLIGISDNGTVKGIQLGKESQKNWANQISQSTEPRVIPEIEVCELDGKSVVAIRIKEHPIKPVSLKGRCYKRAGNSNRILTLQEIAQIHLHSTGMSWDKLSARDAQIKDINLEKIKRYIKISRETGRRKIGDDEDPIQVLEKLDLLKDGIPTWAAILLFRKDPHRFVSQAAIHCGRFKEETIVIDDRMIEGTIIEQIDEAMDFIRKNINVEFVMTGRPEREQVWDYPLEALREAVINAVCHRDYTISSNVEIRIYDDRLVVWSPGGLPLGITLEELYKPHSSELRNKGIAEIFYDMELIEQWGSGIDKMREGCRTAGLPEPVLEEYQGFRVIFRKDIYTEEYLRSLGLNERQMAAVMYVKERRSINMSTFKALTLEVAEKTLYRDLRDLVNKKVLKQVGEKKGRKYELK